MKIPVLYLLVPVIISEVYNDWNQHGEGLILVGLEDVEEVVILKEAHSSISYLQVNTTDASDNTFEEFGDQMLNLVNFADFQDFLQLSQEQSLLDAVGEGPVL